MFEKSMVAIARDVSCSDGSDLGGARADIELRDLSVGPGFFQKVCPRKACCRIATLQLSQRRGWLLSGLATAAGQ